MVLVIVATPRCGNFSEIGLLRPDVCGPCLKPYPPGVEKVEVYAVYLSKNVHCPFQVNLPFAARTRLVKISPFPLGSDAVPGSGTRAVATKGIKTLPSLHVLKTDRIAWVRRVNASSQRVYLRFLKERYFSSAQETILRTILAEFRLNLPPRRHAIRPRPVQPGAIRK